MKFPKLSTGAKIAIAAGAITTATVITGAALTKAGYIPNYLEIPFLDSKLETTEFMPSGFMPTSKPSFSNGTTSDKPVIYLYPEQTQETLVQLDYHGELIADYPEYDEAISGWQVTANPDGTLINNADGLEYSYLFWEGQPKEKIDWNLNEGFVVKGEDTREFLQEVLKKIGLTPKEYNEFIVYWYPLMKDNPYNLIHFAGEKYTQTAPLTITPKPDSLLRVFMVFKSLDEFFDISKQEFPVFNREGFTVVEWGGTQLK